MSYTHFSGPIVSLSSVANGYASTATAAGTTVLHNDAAGQQFFTGSTTQTIKMPDATTVPLGYSLEFTNRSSGTITIQKSDASSIGTVSSNARTRVVCTANSTAAGSWDIL
jgi:hypothetical protein